MKMTFGEYIQNPMGRRNAVFTQTEMYRELYTNKLNAIIVREGGMLNYVLYTHKDEYYIHMKVPSEVIDEFYYDVVVRFYTDDPRVKERRDLDRYYVQFFSNDPAFVYTFAHAFRTNNMFIEMLKEKMSKEAIRKKPRETNPDQVVGYVKSLFFCFLVMESRGLFDKVQYEVYGTKLKKKTILDDITPADIKIADRQKAEEDKRHKEKRSRDKAARSSSRSNTREENLVSGVRTAPKSSTVNRKTVKTTKRSPSVKRSKRI